MISIFLLVLANIVYIIYNMIKGKQKLKEAIKEAKKKRIAQEEKERQEEEERKRKRKEKEEEFSKLPDETNNVSQDANTTHHNNTTIAELKGKKGKQAKKKKGDGLDAVEEHSVGGSDKHGPGGAPDKRPGSTESNQKQGGQTKGKVSDKESRSSMSIDSEKEGKVIR